MTPITEDMAVYAFRYALGRMTSAPATVADWLFRHWDDLSVQTRRQIESELDKAFKEDDAQRAMLPPKDADIPLATYQRLGHDCDRATWERVRALYREHIVI